MIKVEQIQDPQQLRQIAALLRRENETLQRRLQQLTREIAPLRQQDAQRALALEIERLHQRMDALQREKFGDSSERRPRDEDKKDDKPTSRRGNGRRSQPALTVLEQIHELNDDEKACPCCGGELEPLGDSFEESEEVTAPGPPKAVEGGRYSLDFAVEVTVAKYADHLPLDRQRRMLAREGLVVESQTLWDQAEGLAQVLRRAYDALHRRALDADVLHADETWWRLWRRRPTKRWWVWTLASDEVVYHRVDPSRSREVILGLLAEYSGTVLMDGYNVYQILIRDGPRRRLAHCWAHVRRKFVEAEPHYPESCGRALPLIGELYDIERGLLDPVGLQGEDRSEAVALRSRIRDERSRPVIEQLKAWAFEQRATPESGLRKAVDYMLSLWPGLTLFLDDPRLCVDNNHVERQLRGVVLGRKTHYGSRSKRGTEVAALFYSLIDTARLHGLDPRHYLREAAIAGLRRPAEILLPQDLSPKEAEGQPTE